MHLDFGKQFIAISLALLLVTVPQVAMPETFGHALATNCPNGKQIGVLLRKEAEASAMVDVSRFALSKQLSLEEYRCSTVVSSPYLRDIAKYFTESDLYLSLRTNGDAIEKGPHIVYTLNELAAATKFADIRKMSLQLKRTVQELYDSANAIVNPTPAPEPTSSDP